MTRNGYQDAVRLENTDPLPAGVSLDLGGWTADFSAKADEFATEGWQTSSPGATLTVTVDAGYLELFYMSSNQAGTVQITVDGAPAGQISVRKPVYPFCMPFHAIHFSAPGVHRVQVTLLEGDGDTPPWFGICALGVANFE